uniref:translation initiation factor IF-2-like n=1 Tax=Nyctereutes procyonoides TaxID=34880 RepID=UPI002444078E|nr:translation initiation factor IF-2-like [Nyctereutes procyonoides]
MSLKLLLVSERTEEERLRDFPPQLQPPRRPRAARPGRSAGLLPAPPPGSRPQGPSHPAPPAAAERKQGLQGLQSAGRTGGDWARTPRRPARDLPSSARNEGAAQPARPALPVRRLPRDAERRASGPNRTDPGRGCPAQVRPRPPAPPPRFPAGPLRPHLSAGHPAARPSRLIPAAAQARREASGNAAWAFPFCPSPHAPRSAGAGSDGRCHSLSPTNREDARTRRLPTRPAAPAPRAAEPEVRRPEVASSWAPAGLSLPPSGAARPRLDGASAPPSGPPPPPSRSRPRPPAAALATTSGAPRALLPG